MQIKDIELKKLRAQHDYSWIKEFLKVTPEHVSPIKCDDNIDIKKAQEQLSNKSFTKMGIPTNKDYIENFKRVNDETGYSYKLSLYSKITDLLDKDVLFNRFMARCVHQTGKNENILIEMFAEFLTMMSDCEDIKQDN
jgi:hypothetical protein